MKHTLKKILKTTLVKLNKQRTLQGPTFEASIEENISKSINMKKMHLILMFFPK